VKGDQINRLVKEATMGLGPYTNAYEVMDRAKQLRPRLAPPIRRVAWVLHCADYVRKTGRIITLWTQRPGGTMAIQQKAVEYEVLERRTRG